MVEKKSVRKKKAVAPRSKAKSKPKAGAKPQTATPPKATKESVNKKSKVDYDLILKNWNLMNGEMSTLAEKDLSVLITMEQDGKNRIHMLNRIHARYSRVRSERERREILAGKKLKM